SLSSALEKVRWYSCRWYIEELFRILKSGYKAEKVQFDSGHALMNWCALRLIMAVRLLHLLTQRDVEIPDSALPPGQECLWRGLDSLESAVIGFQAALE
ncbi:MAG: transposase, partial [bacterium]|nr:transposase [bacterium]